MQLTPSERAEITIQTKAGIVGDGPYFDFSYEHMIESVDGSLRALQTDYIDILLLHRPDALVEPEEVARAFDELEACRQGPGLRRLQPHAAADRPAQDGGAPADHREPAAAVDHARADHRAGRGGEHGRERAVAHDRRRRDPGLLPDERHHRAGVVAVPGGILQRGLPRLGRVPRAQRGHRPAGREATTCPAIAIATAWITRHPADMQVVLGTTTPERVAGAALGSDIPLTRPEWYELFRPPATAFPEHTLAAHPPARTGALRATKAKTHGQLSISRQQRSQSLGDHLRQLGDARLAGR